MIKYDDGDYTTKRTQQRRVGLRARRSRRSKTQCKWPAHHPYRWRTEWISRRHKNQTKSATDHDKTPLTKCQYRFDLCLFSEFHQLIFSTFLSSWVIQTSSRPQTTIYWTVARSRRTAVAKTTTIFSHNNAENEGGGVTFVPYFWKYDPSTTVRKTAPKWESGVRKETTNSGQTGIFYYLLKGQRETGKEKGSPYRGERVFHHTIIIHLNLRDTPTFIWRLLLASSQLTTFQPDIYVCQNEIKGRVKGSDIKAVAQRWFSGANGSGGRKKNGPQWTIIIPPMCCGEKPTQQQPPRTTNPNKNEV